jgi:octanoyl-[GcvH]:protein N-octanoyltransferase
VGAPEPGRAGGRVALLRASFPERPALGTAVSRAILLRAAAGELPPTIRVARPGPVLAFGRQDAASRGYPDAVRAAREAGFEPVERLAGGRAAVFHEGTLSLSMAVPDHTPAARTEARFEGMAEVVRTALARLGLDARIGEVPGEYCPGAWSVNARGRSKLAGIGQRLISGAAHLGGVVVVTGAGRVRDVLVPVYRALELDWDPATAGSVELEVPGLDLETVERSLLTELAARYDPVESELDPETIALAERLEHEHRAPARRAPGLGN